MKKTLVFITLLISLSLSSFAVDIASGSFYNLRSMALGNSTFTTNPGETALFTNPALLSLNDKGHFTLMGFSDGVNGEGEDVQKTILEMMGDIVDKKELSTGIAELDGKKFADLTEAEMLKYINYRQKQTNGKTLTRFTNLGLLSYAGKGFGTGLFLSESITDGEIKSAPKVIVKGNVKLEVPIGLAFNFGEEKQIHVGASLRYMNFLKFDTDVGVTDLMSFSKNADDLSPLGISVNNGFGLNLGGAYTFTDYNTTVGLSIQDLWSTVSTTVLSSTDDLTAMGGDSKGTLMPNMRLGVTSKPLDWVEVTGEIDNLLSKNLDGIEDTRDSDIFKKIHFGTEVTPLLLTPAKDWKWLDLKLRLGNNQGYWTYGVGTRVLFLNFDYTHFTEEIGYTAGQDPNQINAIGMSIKF